MRACAQAMNHPPSWQDHAGTFGRKNGWRGAGCTGRSAPGDTGDAEGCTSHWCKTAAPLAFASLLSPPEAWSCCADTNYTWIPGKQTMAPDSEMLTGFKNGQPESACLGPMEKNSPWGCTPWMAPGTAPLFSPCGINGGNPMGCDRGNPSPDNCGAGGWGHGPDARTLPGNDRPYEWKRGTNVEVSWGVLVNRENPHLVCPLLGQALTCGSCVQTAAATGTRFARNRRGTGRTWT